MFADDSNLFWFHQNVNALSRKFNEELKKVGDWFKLNKLSLNNRKTKYTLFHKKSSKDDLPLKLPALKVGDNKIERKKTIKFLGVMLDYTLSCKEYICTVKTNLAKILDDYAAQSL